VSRIKLADIVDDRRECEVDLGNGATLPVVYHPQRVTAGFYSRAMKLLREDDPGFACKALEDVLISMDLEGPIDGRLEDGSWGRIVEEGAPVPITADVLQWIPQWILMGILDGIARDSAPDPTKMAKH
jgi:hypothetical protein